MARNPEKQTIPLNLAETPQSDLKLHREISAILLLNFSAMSEGFGSCNRYSVGG